MIQVAMTQAVTILADITMTMAPTTAIMTMVIQETKTSDQAF
jgi:hypothetical protein